MPSDEQQIIHALKSSGHSVTSVRLAVFRELAKAESLTMGELTKKLKHDADRASVYRTVELFERLGIVQRIQVGWKYRLELSDTFNPHHHHIHCIQCSRVVSLSEDAALERHISSLAHQAGFQLTSHQLELSGLCESCSKKELGVGAQL